VAHDDVREQGYDNGRATSGGIIVVAAFAMVLVIVTGVGVAVALRVSGAMHVLCVLGEELGPAICRGQIRIDRGWCLEEEGRRWLEVETAMCRRGYGRGKGEGGFRASSGKKVMRKRDI